MLYVPWVIVLLASQSGPGANNIVTDSVFVDLFSTSSSCDDCSHGSLDKHG